MDFCTGIDDGRLAHAQTATPEPGTWFEAPTAFGPMWLCLPTPAPARHAAAAALVLQHAEELIAGLDSWTAHPLPWRWLPGPAAERPAGMHALAQGRHADWEWFVPWAWLRAHAAPHDLLNCLLHWPAVPAVLSLARLQLSDGERQQLEPGGAVLLPASLQPDWHGWVRSAAEPMLGGSGSPAGVPVALPSPWTPRPARGEVRLDGLAGVGHGVDHGKDGGTPVEVRLDAPDRLPGHRLAGWPDELDGLDFTAAEAGLWRSQQPGEPPHRIACGRLIPWGDGWALALDSLDAAPERAPTQTV